MNLALQLLGKPVLTVAGNPATVGARKNLQLLALLALAPDQKLDRDRIGELLWADEPADRRREHLRPVASRLKVALAQLGYPDLLKSEGHAFKLDQPIPIDLDAIFEGRSPVHQDQFQPVMAGWDEELVRDARLRVQTALARNLESDISSYRQKDLPQALALLASFLTTYPRSTRMTAIYYKLLREDLQYDAASAVIQRFETLWLDEEGPVGMPDIEQEACKINFDPPSIAIPLPKYLGLRRTLLVAVCMVVLACVGWTLRPKPIGRAHPWQFYGWKRATDSGDYNGYIFCPDGVTWDEASAFAKAARCHLAVPVSRGRNKALFDGTDEAFARDDTIPGWLGIHLVNGKWVTEDGMSLVYTNWDSDLTLPKGETQTCVGYHIVRETSEAPWAPYPCSALADGFYLDAGLTPPSSIDTAALVENWRYPRSLR